MKKVKPNKNNNLTDLLCVDLLIEIFLFLYGIELLKIKGTCKIFSCVIDNPILWKEKTNRLLFKDLRKLSLSPKTISIMEYNNFVPNIEQSNEILNDVIKEQLGSVLLRSIGFIIKFFILNCYKPFILAVNTTGNKFTSVDKANFTVDYEYKIVEKLYGGEITDTMYFDSNMTENKPVKIYEKSHYFYHLPEIYEKRIFVEIFLKNKGHVFKMWKDEEKEIIFVFLKIK